MRGRWGSVGSSAAALTVVLMATACAGNDSGSAQTAAESPPAAQTALPRPPGSLTDWLSEMRQRVATVPAAFLTDAPAAQKTVLDVYVNKQEYVEIYYGETGRVSKGGPLGSAVMNAERMFHDLMVLVGAANKGDSTRVRVLVDSLDAQLADVSKIAIESGVQLTPPDTLSDVAAVPSTERRDLKGVIARVDSSRDAFRGGDPAAARRMLEHAYLEEFEPLEPLLASATVARIEELVHMRLRPRLGGGHPASEVDSVYSVLRAGLVDANAELEGGRSAWFGTVSSFALLVREGLEAILLIGAMIAYLSRADGLRSHIRHVYVGSAAGLGLSIATWVVARTLIPIDGGSRELMEGITALIAVGVLLYVSHWIFRRTYMGEWKKFLQEQVNKAVSRGSGIAIAGLAFAAVYREGFETVLFYQALLADMPGSSVALGFGVGSVVIAAVGFAIVQAGLKLPLNIVFRATNAVLLFLSVAILGKGLYNLQEAGLFSPTPLEWLPNSEVLRQVLGFYPLAETLLAQLALITLVVVMYVIYRRRRVSAMRQAAA